MPRDSLPRSIWVEALNQAQYTLGQFSVAANNFTDFTIATEQVRSTVEALAPWELELLSGSAETNEVGIPNETEGENNMPEVGTEYITVQIEQTGEARENLFESLRMREQILGSVDPEVWAQAARDLATAAQPVAHQVAVGRYDVGRPQNRINGRVANVGWVSVATANEIVRAASNNRINLVEDAQNGGMPYMRLKMITDIEDQEWLNYFSDRFYASMQAGTWHIAVNELRSHMDNYSEFRRRVRNTRVRNRLRANLQTPSVPVDNRNIQDRANAFGAHLAKTKNNLVKVAEPFKLMTILPHGTLSSRRWGIEIEAVDIEGVDTPKHWVLHGDGSLRSLSENFTRPGDENPDAETLTDHSDECTSHELDPDCSCGDCYNECSCGYDEQQWAIAAASGGNSNQSKVGEWNSPILRSIHSRGLKYITDKIEFRNKNTSPGIHVHVEASDLTPEQAAKLSVIYAAMEPLFESEYKRDVRTYCESPDVSELISRFQKAKSVKGRPDGIRSMKYGSRYWTVNLAALAKQGTVEFRAMGPEYNYDKLVRWGAFCREMVNIAKADVPQAVWSRVKTFEDLITVFSIYGKETPTPPWAKTRPEIEKFTLLGTENRRVPNVILPPRGSNAPVDLFDDYSGAAVHTTTRVLVNG